MTTRFRDRAEAGQRLADALAGYAGRADLLVLALPRGGVPVGFEVARRLHAPLDVLVVRKLGVPGHEELAMGAIASGVRVLNEHLLRDLGIGPSTIDQVAEAEGRELERRERLFRGARPGAPVKGRTVILVDDGLATGATMRAAIEALRQRKPREIVVAVPVGAPETCAALGKEAGSCVCPLQPLALDAIGRWYEDFSQTPDDEVRSLLDEAHEALTRR